MSKDFNRIDDSYSAEPTGWEDAKDFAPSEVSLSEKASEIGMMLGESHNEEEARQKRLDSLKKSIMEGETAQDRLNFYRKRGESVTEFYKHSANDMGVGRLAPDYKDQIKSGNREYINSIESQRDDEIKNRSAITKGLDFLKSKVGVESEADKINKKYDQDVEYYDSVAEDYNRRMDIYEKVAENPLAAGIAQGYNLYESPTEKAAKEKAISKSIERHQRK